MATQLQPTLSPEEAIVLEAGVGLRWVTSVNLTSIMQSPFPFPYPYPVRLHVNLL